MARRPRRHHKRQFKAKAGRDCYFCSKTAAGPTAALTGKPRIIACGRELFTRSR